MNWKARNVVMFDLPSGTWCSPLHTPPNPPPLAHMSQRVKSSKEPAGAGGGGQTWRMRNATRHFCKLDENLWLFSAPSKDTHTRTHLRCIRLKIDMFWRAGNPFDLASTKWNCCNLLSTACETHSSFEPRHNEKHKKGRKKEPAGHKTYGPPTQHTHTHGQSRQGQGTSFWPGCQPSPSPLDRPFGLCCKLFSCAVAHATNKTNSSFKFPKFISSCGDGGGAGWGWGWAGLTLNKLLAICWHKNIYVYVCIILACYPQLRVLLSWPAQARSLS